jgi:hypothetical protein
MNTLSVKQTGVALGATGAALYVGCALIMTVLPHEVVIRLFNSLLHGFDVTSIMRWDIPWWEAVIGIVETFILGWLSGAVFAVVYNLPAQRASHPHA